MSDKNDWDINRVLFEFCPTIFHLFIAVPRYLERISRRHKAKMKYLGDKLKEEQIVSTETNFLDLPLRYLMGEEIAGALLKFIDSSVKSNIDSLEAHHQPAFLKIVKDMVANFDNERSNLWDRLGEILVLNYFINRKGYKLIDIEYTLKNGKTIDYLFLDNYGQKHLLMEVLNINLKEDKVEDKKGLMALLNHRTDVKYEDKTKGLLITDMEFSMIIQPVIWAHSWILQEFKDSVMNYGNPHKVLEPCILWFIENRNTKQYNFKFGPISEIL